MDPLRRALADNLGKTITPELCVLLEAAAGRIAPDPTPIDLAQFEPYAHGDYVISVERFDSVLPELLPLHDLHWYETELHRHGLALKPNYQAMSAHDGAGNLLQFTVRHLGALVGNLRMFVLPSMHTDGRIAEEDTLFVHPDHRDGMLGLKLLRYAESCLRKIGVESIEANSKTLNNADVLLRRMGYTPVAIMFHKILKD
jgi:GNAT superfamily N-acetyltransferase